MHNRPLLSMGVRVRADGDQGHGLSFRNRPTASMSVCSCAPLSRVLYRISRAGDITGTTAPKTSRNSTAAEIRNVTHRAFSCTLVNSCINAAADVDHLALMVQGHQQQIPFLIAPARRARW